MWELVKAGGWLMMPLILCSIAACAIIIERSLRLRKARLLPDQLLASHADQIQAHQVNLSQLQSLKESSVLGAILASGIQSAHRGQAYTEQQLQLTAAEQVHLLEKNLNFLGTIGAIAPLLGLLGTVIGIIESFMAVSAGGVTDPAMLASGISQALITTAAGMVVAIPALVAYRYFQRRVLDITIALELQANQLLILLFHAQDADPAMTRLQQDYLSQGAVEAI
jgi:biopolymer transport protein ExbB